MFRPNGPTVLGNSGISDIFIHDVIFRITAIEFIKIGGIQTYVSIAAENMAELTPDSRTGAGFNITYNRGISAFGDSPEKRLLEPEPFLV